MSLIHPLNVRTISISPLQHHDSVCGYLMHISRRGKPRQLWKLGRHLENLSKRRDITAKLRAALSELRSRFWWSKGVTCRTPGSLRLDRGTVARKRSHEGTPWRAVNTHESPTFFHRNIILTPIKGPGAIWGACGPPPAFCCDRVSVYIADIGGGVETKPLNREA